MTSNTTSRSHDAAPFGSEDFPAFRAISSAFFHDASIVFGGQAPLELVGVPMPSCDSPEFSEDVFNFLMDYGLLWEAGPWRARDLYQHVPPRLDWLRRLSPEADVVLLPEFEDDIYEKYSTLFHLLPQRTLQKYRLPSVERGGWPRTGVSFGRRLRRGMEGRLSQALATHLWPLLLGRSRARDFSDTDPIHVLAHDLDYWLGPMEQVIREIVGTYPRVAGKEDFVQEARKNNRVPDELTIESPKMGGELWVGEEEAWDISRRLVEMADQTGELRALIETITTNRVEDDFSSRWSFHREDFERKLYRKRDKVRVTFVELDDTIPYLGRGSDIEGEMVWRDLLAVVDPKDRRVVVCLRNGHTKLVDIAEELGYANHSPVSKALSRIRKRAAELLDR